MIGFRGGWLLASGGGEVGHEWVHDLDVRGGFTESHVDADLLELGDRHGVGDVKLFAQRLLDLGLVLLLESCCHDCSSLSPRLPGWVLARVPMRGVNRCYKDLNCCASK